MTPRAAVGLATVALTVAMSHPAVLAAKGGSRRQGSTARLTRSQSTLVDDAKRMVRFTPLIWRHL